MSPTMAVPKDRRIVNKEQLATIVRKDFNAAMIHEQDTITAFMYAVQNQGKQVHSSLLKLLDLADLLTDKSFKMKFDPRSGK